MGLMRKTLSISTLGIVNFRSKGERLERAMKRRDDLASELEKTELRIEEATRERDAAQKRAEVAELESLSEAKKARKAKRRAKKRASDASEVPTTAELVDDAVALSRRARKKVAKSTRKAAKVTAKQAGKAKGHLEDLAES